jgi:outer membrane protein assembly factor BamD (BamD/ComL family)
MDFSFSSSASLPPLQEHPVYATGIAHMRAAQWQQAFQSFELLKDIYPEDPEVKELFRQAEMRANRCKNYKPCCLRTRKRLKR